jgi:hypothetical protein
MRDSAVRPAPDFAEPVIGPATSGRARWLHPGYGYCALTSKACRDLVERRARPVLGRPRRPADVNKAGDALVRL